MAIAPPSDIVLDVAKAADPTRLQAATAKLAQMAAGGSGTVDFASALSATTGKSAGIQSSTMAPTVPDDHTTHKGLSHTSPYQRFEAVVLQNFVESILPKDKDLFGDAASADEYRSMLADQLATQLSKSGRIGIAQAIEKAHGQSHGAVAAQLHKTTGISAS